VRRESTPYNQVDWLLVGLYFLLVLAGWLNIYAAVYEEENVRSIFDISTNSGKQVIWIVTSLILIFMIFIIDFRFWDSVAHIIYGLLILLLIFVLFFGREVAGSRSWFEIGAIRLQPAEFTKFGAAIALAKFMSEPGFRISRAKDQLIAAVISFAPSILIILQGDTGSALVFVSLLFPMYREGLPIIYIWLGFSMAAIFILALVLPTFVIVIGLVVIGLVIVLLNKKTTRNIFLVVVSVLSIMAVVWSVDYVFNEVLKPHQQNRIRAFLNPDADPSGSGYNVIQSKIAIGSGGFLGKGYLNGTQTKGDFVPEQSTDFIFCTLGEEHGWIGSLVLIFLFMALLFRIIRVSERQKSKFARIYGYGVAGIIFFHFLVNIGMTIGLFPVIGIPLPFFSYGGSSLWAFTVLLFVLVKMDAHRMQILTR